MTLGALRLQLASVSRRPMTWILLAVLGVYALLVFGSFILLLRAPETEALDPELILGPMREGGLAYVAQLYLSIATIVMIVFSASLIGQEFSRGTLRTLLLMRVRRSDFAWAGLMTVVIGAFALAVIGVAVTLLAAWAFSAAAGEDLLRIDGAAGAMRTVASLLVRAVVSLGAWGVFAYSFTFLTRSLLAGIGGTMAFQIVGGFLGAFVGSLGDAGRYASRVLLTTAIDRIALPPQLELGLADAAWVGANLAAWLGVTTWWAFHRFHRMDALAATRPG